MIPYGRGAEAIARQCREEGVHATIEDAQRLIDAYFDNYPCVRDFLDECERRVQDPMWVRGVYGRYRRFYYSDDPSVLADMGRQACNFPIQNAVADAVWTAIRLMGQWREREGVPFDLLLQIHDAILVEAEFAHVPVIYRRMFPECMEQGVAIWPTDLDGRRLAGIQQPYHLGCGRDLMFRWGEDVDDLIQKELGVDHPSLTQLLKDPANDQDVVRLLRRLESVA